MEEETRELLRVIQLAARRRGWTQEQLAVEAGVSTATISLARSRKTLTLKTLLKLCKALDLKVSIKPC